MMSCPIVCCCFSLPLLFVTRLPSHEWGLLNSRMELCHKRVLLSYCLSWASRVSFADRTPLDYILMLFSTLVHRWIYFKFDQGLLVWQHRWPWLSWSQRNNLIQERGWREVRGTPETGVDTMKNRVQSPGLHVHTCVSAVGIWSCKIQEIQQHSNHDPLYRANRKRSSMLWCWEPRPAGQFGHAVTKCDFRMVIGIMALSPVKSGMNSRLWSTE